MRPNDWHLTDDLDGFLARAGDFLRSRPALHTTPLTALEKLRARGADASVFFGVLEPEGQVSAVCYRLATHRLTLTPCSDEHADALAAHLAGLGTRLVGVTADHDTATAFAEAWQRHAGATPASFWGARLYRLGTLTPPEPVPAGQGRVAGAQDHEQVVRWCGEFAAAVGEAAAMDARAWADSRFADKHYTFWELPDGTAVSMAGSTSMVGGMIRVDPVYTPARLRGRGYAGAVTAAVSGAALAAGATDVVLFADPANATSNALYQRIGYVPMCDFTGYAFSSDTPAAR
ncbi:GNAT family N-acetyltransferase [Nonomuraea gerenzanensis]|uniref:GCN5-related N-acetyltransferase n=1 Tax=Nonomuraea gerenzanensis TaxID=93944 RepID=A0A1M4EQX8_9ACTN|nr:GNAT family N-acetyltransferase [Nonomuraea gerenzanensis]UBU12671.1 GNAT family N-acetyltransferase [Nonomuraea gerenzanensis]SBP01228.1 GCN5-related N-acetyltransferase [Nonomuraea gerenzanensis]